MFFTLAMALFIQPDTDLIAYNKPQMNFKMPKVEMPKVEFTMPNFHKTQEQKQVKYLYEIRKRELKAEYEKSLLPKSGYQTRAQYEAESRVKDKARESDVEFLPVEQDKNMKYVPQPVYKLVRYNDPPGSPELSLHRKFKFNREEKNYGLVTNDISLMVYPVVYYYVDRNTTAGDIFALPLDKTLPDTQRILKANVARRWQNPILQTDKSTDVRNTFRTMTPIDFSADCTKLVAKEKIGNTFDGIWQTNLWVYDFKTKKAYKLVEVREAILYYWQKVKGFNLENYRWDIYPLGFDRRKPNRVIVNAYAYTGKKPKFLGAWSIDFDGNASKLESLKDQTPDVSIIGFKIKESGVKSPEQVKFETKHAKDLNKIVKKEAKKEKKLIKKAKKENYKAKLKTLKEEYHKNLKKYDKKVSSNGAPTE